MGALMSLEAAIRLLKGQPGSIEELGPEFVQHARAAATYSDAVRDGRVGIRPLHRTTDAAPVKKTVGEMSDAEFDALLARKGLKMRTRVRDAWLGTPKTEGSGADIEPADPRTPRSGVFGAQEATRLAGSKLVRRLSGGLTDWFVSAIPDDPDGGVGLYQVVSANNAGDPGKMTADQRRRIAVADAARSRTTLQSINERNRAAWAGR